MSHDLNWTKPVSGRLVLRQPSDGEDDSRAQDEDVEQQDMAAQLSELKRDLEKQISGRFSKEKRALSKEIEDLRAQLASKQQEQQQQDDDQQPDSDSNATSDGMTTGMKAQMGKLQKQLDRLQAQNDELAKSAADKEQQMRAERRKHAVESELVNLKAVRPEQAYRIIQDMIVEDDEIGDAVPVKTEHGDDLVPVKEYLSTFKEENPHLFAASVKSGSGAGGGDAGQGRARFSTQALGDPSKGGMDWATYEKNREAIHRDLEGSA